MSRFKFISLAILLGLPVVGFAQRGPSFQQQTGKQLYGVPDVSDATQLQKDVIQNVYVAAGFVSYLEFPQDKPVERVAVGAQSLVDVKHDPETNAIAIYPLVVSGQTNMVVTINKVPYVFQIMIRKQGEINYRLSYTVSPTTQEMTIPFGPAVKPSEINTSKFVNIIETYGKLRVPAKEHSDLLYSAVNKSYSWNGNLIYLSDAWAFPKDNLVVLRVVRRNTSADASYLHIDQLRPYVGNTFFPAIASVQSNPTLFPGQMDRIYLFLQGYNLVADNPFELALPPDQAALSKLQIK